MPAFLTMARMSGEVLKPYPFALYIHAQREALALCPFRFVVDQAGGKLVVAIEEVDFNVAIASTYRRDFSRAGRRRVGAQGVGEVFDFLFLYDGHDGAICIWLAVPNYMSNPIAQRGRA